RDRRSAVGSRGHSLGVRRLQALTNVHPQHAKKRRVLRKKIPRVRSAHDRGIREAADARDDSARSGVRPGVAVPQENSGLKKKSPGERRAPWSYKLCGLAIWAGGS